MDRFARALLILAMAGGLAGCATARAQVPPAPVVLDTPAPPPRVVIPETLEPEPPPPAPPPAPAPVDTTPARPPRPANSTPRPAPPVEPVTPPPVTDPPPVLQTAANANAAEQIELRVNAKLAAATKDLTDVKFNELSAEAKAQYERAQGLIRQANNALKVKNYPFAEELAGKAATLASQLRKLNDPISS